MAKQDRIPSQDPEREARIQRILQEVEKKLRQSLPNPQQSLEKIEKQVRDIGREISDVIERETLDSLGTGYEGAHTRCVCGAPARYVVDLSRHLVTLNGYRDLTRAYYHCARCHAGFCPLDAHLEIGRGESSVGVRALTARFAGYLPFVPATEELAAVTGIRVSGRTVQRDAEAVGDAFAAIWRERERRLWAGLASPPTARPGVLQITMDGVQIPVGKGWREARVGCVYQPRPEGGVEQAQYAAMLTDSVTFGRRMRTLAHEAGVAYCRKVGVVGDGAEWIWQEAAKHFPRAVEILDYYHAMEYVWEFARARFAEAEAVPEWIDAQHERLLDDRVGEMLKEMEEWEPTKAEHEEVKRRVVNYLRSHEHRMKYKTYRQQGFHIGSGVAEAGCKSVVQARLKGTGMRWSEAGADAMLHLRAAWCSTGRTDFLEASRRATLVS
jgi:hypothetical protein